MRNYKKFLESIKELKFKFACEALLLLLFRCRCLAAAGENGHTHSDGREEREGERFAQKGKHL